MKITVQNTNGKKILVPTGNMASGDFFKCQNCGYTIRMLVRGDTATCSQCGGRMVRI